jgi:hypothetical protein
MERATSRHVTSYLPAATRRRSAGIRSRRPARVNAVIPAGTYGGKTVTSVSPRKWSAHAPAERIAAVSARRNAGFLGSLADLRRPQFSQCFRSILHPPFGYLHFCQDLRHLLIAIYIQTLGYVKHYFLKIFKKI